MRRFIMSFGFVIGVASLFSAAEIKTPINSSNQSFKNIFLLHKSVRKGPHIQIIVTPPGKVGKTNNVFVEVHNRTNEGLTGVDFNVELINTVGLEIKADMRTDPMAKNASWSSGGQEFAMPKNVDKGKLPAVKSAVIHRISIYDEKGTPRVFKVYLDVNRS